MNQINPVNRNHSSLLAAVTAEDLKRIKQVCDEKLLQDWKKARLHLWMHGANPVTPLVLYLHVV